MQKFHEIGDRVTHELPYSEVCMHMRVAGKVMTVEILPTCAQLYNDDGSIFSSPISWGEAGIYSEGKRPYTSED